MCAAYGFIVILISQSHEDENTDLMLSSVFVINPFLGDITRFFESGRLFKNQTATRGRSFCGISNRVLGSMLVMIRRDRHWLVGVCFSFSTGKTNFSESAQS